MDAVASEAFVVERAAEAYPRLWVTGMAVCATFGGPRMGPIFGGMPLSGKRVADLGEDMKKIGILGGMSPESTTLYYEHITRNYTEQYGDYGYPEILIHSVNFQKFVDWQRNGQWHEAAREMATALERLHVAGADFGLIATNTMHFVFDEVQQAVHMPLLSIVDATVEAILTAGLRSVGLLGTVFTMRERFFRDRLERSGITALVPEPADQMQMNKVIYQELCRGEILPDSRRRFLEIIERLRDGGAQGIILGCTEIPLLLQPQHCDLPLFNTALLHAGKALAFAIQPEK